MVSVITNGECVHFGGVRWWAEGGIIHHENQNTGAYGSQTVKVTLQRLKALNDMIGNTRGDKGIAEYADQLQNYQRYIEGILGLCETAQEQGRPEDPRVLKQKVEDLQARRGRSIVVPGLNSSF